MKLQGWNTNSPWRRVILLALVSIIALVAMGCNEPYHSKFFVISADHRVPVDRSILHQANDIYLDVQAWFGYELANPIQVHVDNLDHSYAQYDPWQNLLVIDERAFKADWASVQLDLMRELVQAFAWKGERFREMSPNQGDFLATGVAAYVFHDKLFNKPFEAKTAAHNTRYMWIAQRNTQSWDHLANTIYARSVDDNGLLLPLSVTYFMLERFGHNRFTETLRAVSHKGYQDGLTQTLGANAGELERSWKLYYGLM